MATKAKRTTRRQSTTSKVSGVSKWKFPLSKDNFIYLAAALGAIALGFVLMLTGMTDDPIKHPDTWANPIAISVAPTILVVAYCVVIPFALMRYGKQDNSTANEQETAA